MDIIHIYIYSWERTYSVSSITDKTKFKMIFFLFALIYVTMMSNDYGYIYISYVLLYFNKLLNILKSNDFSPTLPLIYIVCQRRVENTSPSHFPVNHLKSFIYVNIILLKFESLIRGFLKSDACLHSSFFTHSRRNIGHCSGFLTLPVLNIVGVSQRRVHISKATTLR